MKIIFALLLSCFTTHAIAAIKSEAIEYKMNGTTLEGYVAYDDDHKKRFSGILIVPDWIGVGQFAKDKKFLKSIFK